MFAYGAMKGIRAALLAGILSIPAMAEPGDLVRLTEGGAACLPVIVGERAGERVKTAAADLAAYLGRMAGCVFDVKTGKGKSGVVVGLPADFPEAALPTAFDPTDPWRREEYSLRSDNGALYLIGATEKAVEDAVWDVLRRLGYRHFFPGTVWEVFPSTPDLQIAVDDRCGPDYRDRRLHYLMFSHGAAVGDAHRFWALHNRVGSGLRIVSSHAYQGFYYARKEAFDAHPEFWPLIDGERVYWKNTFKPCLSNPDCRRLIGDIALTFFEKNPDAVSISMEPSDGGNWCGCEACGKRTPSDWAVLLANEVAQAVNAPDADPPHTRYVGLLAYHHHSDPPAIRVDPRVAVTVTSHFRESTLSPEDLIEAWRRQGAKLLGFDHNAGGEGTVGRLPQARRELAHWCRDHRLFRWSTAGGVQWGHFGLGAYLAAQALWDVDATDLYDELLADFYRRAFGQAATPMEAYFRLFYRFEDGDSPPAIEARSLARMFRLLHDAHARADGDDGARNRIGEWAFFTGHLELKYRLPRVTDPWEKTEGYNELARLAYWCRGSCLFILPKHLQNQTEWPPPLAREEAVVSGLTVDAALVDFLPELAPKPPSRDDYVRLLIEEGLRRYPDAAEGDRTPGETR